MINELPEGWAETTIGFISKKITKGSTPTSYGYSYKDEGISFVKTENIDSLGNIKDISAFIDDETNRFLKRSILQEKDVLFSIAGTIGRVGIVKKSNLPANTNQALAIIRSYWDMINVRYIFHLLRSNYAQRQASGSIVGVGRANVSLTNINEFKIPLPPFPEQNRIVSKIEELLTRIDSGIESLKQVQTLLKKYRQSVLKSAVEGKLTSEWRKQHKDEIEPSDKLLDRILKERKEKWEAVQFANFKAKGKNPPNNWQNKYKEPATPDTSKLPKLPEGWALVNLDLIADAIDPNPSHRMPKYVEKGIPFISTENFIETEDIDFTIGKQVSDTTLKEQIERFKINKGNFVLSRIGTIGKTRFLPKERKYCLSHALVVIQSTTERIDSKFLRYIISSDYVLQQAKKGVQSVGVPDLGMGKIRSFILPIMNINEQQAIVNKIESCYSVINNLESLINSELKRSHSLRQSILKKAFEGKLVPQDPNDEPASVLLERIKAEKSNPKKSKQMEMF